MSQDVHDLESKRRKPQHFYHPGSAGNQLVLLRLDTVLRLGFNSFWEISILYRILYSSSAAQRFGLPELKELLQQARSDNLKLGISGLLLFHDQSFMQVIEGEEDKVKELYYEHIFLDRRHVSVHALISEPIEKRCYGEWSMGFEWVDDHTLEGYFAIPKGGLNNEFFYHQPGLADKLLMSFSRSNI